MTLSIGWSFVLAGVIVVGLFVWLVIVLRQDRRPKQRLPAQGNSKHRDVMGGQFDASGGRQVTPRRDEPPTETTRPS
jgi:hypothetical protein